LLNELKRSYSRTCLPENACKFLFHCSAYAYVALDSMVVGMRCAVRPSTFGERRIQDIHEACDGIRFTKKENIFKM
ncbi:hypothetical protein T10_7654, partial [Trichinella papuae]